ncbi:DUF3617 family protein [Halopseudomonas salegens]|uniref:DUF3617 family protein n=1 Tax=Halopseudomonas salegens TaxID=1434072 RepID=A0A1H2DXY0_9GAMM|nr:DUF3617 family protein [Halopseudomonas salegens]SDT87639.1 Protein of unknown function [Halopseudomonas salegens]
MWQSATKSLIACLAGGILLNAQAQDISPLPETGLWQVETTTLINGQDMMSAIREAQRQALSQLPEEQRAMMEAMMQQDEDQVNHECVTNDDLATFSDADALLQDLLRDMPGCSIELTERGGDRLAFAGTCDGEEGFTGDIEGEVVMTSAREMRHTFTGNGTLNTKSNELPPGMQDMTGQVETRHTEIARWVAADCR